MGAGGSSANVQRKGREELTNEDDIMDKADMLRAVAAMSRERSVRTRARDYRQTDFDRIASVKMQAKQVKTKAQEAVEVARLKRAKELVDKTKKLRKYSHAAQVDQQIRDRRAEERAAEQAAIDEKNALQLAFHLVNTTRKYFTAAKGISKVSVFANHNHEFMVSATKPHSNALFETIHFHQGDLPLEAILECGDLEQAPTLNESGEALLTKGANLTIGTRADGSLGMVFNGVETARARDVVSQDVLDDIEEKSLEGWVPTPLTIEKDSPDFAAAAADVQRETRAASEERRDLDEVHASLDRSVTNLQALHKSDEASIKMLEANEAAKTPKKRPSSAGEEERQEPTTETSPVMSSAKPPSIDFDPQNYLKPLQRGIARRGSQERLLAPKDDDHQAADNNNNKNNNNASPSADKTPVRQGSNNNNNNSKAKQQAAPARRGSANPKPQKGAAASGDRSPRSTFRASAKHKLREKSKTKIAAEIAASAAQA